MSRERPLGSEDQTARIIAGAEHVPDARESWPRPLSEGGPRDPSRSHERRASGDKRRNGEGASDDLSTAHGGEELPTIRFMAGQVPRAVNDAEAALIAAGAAIYTRAGTLVRPVSETMPAAGNRTTTVAKLRPMCLASMPDHLARAMRFQRFSKTAEEWVDRNPPVEVVAALLAREGEWKLPPVSGVITTPTMRSDGSILSAPGYDPATRLYLVVDPGFRLANVPERPTRTDAERALQCLKDLICNFPFAGEIDQAVALSGIMTAVVRGGIPTAPLHGIRAHSPGTGKSYLVDIAATIATGRRAPVIAAGKTEEETEKRLGSLLLDAAPVISIDNVNGELGGEALCLMTERPSVKVRILGASKTPEVESRSAVFATGNNLTLLGDMTRRAVICTLDANVERPELRDFDFDPIERVRADRGAYVAAVMIIARAYRVAGMPKVCGPIGSYGEWSDMVRAPLIWLGCADPVASMDTARKGDPELSAIGELFTHWREHLTLSGSYTTRTIISIAASGNDAAEFQDLLFRQAGAGGIISSKRLGKWLSRISGRLVEGAKLEMQADTSHGNRFSLVGPAPYPSRAIEP